MPLEQSQLLPSRKSVIGHVGDPISSENFAESKEASAMDEKLSASLGDIEALVTQCLVEAGASRDQATAVARNIAACERDDCKSHGLFRLPGYLKSILSGKVTRDARPVIRELTPIIIHLDAAGGFAPLAHEVACDDIAERARRFGIAALTITNCYHFTALWTELEPLAATGLIAFAFRNGVSRVAQHGGRTPVFGTNPMAFAWPRRGKPPFIFDFATSEIARGEIQLRQRNGESIPLGWAVDKEGRPTTDPAIGLAGAQLTFGGHKGSALATMIELLSGPLIGEMLSSEALRADNGDGGPPRGGELLIVLDPARFCDRTKPESAIDHAEILFEQLQSDPGPRLAGDAASPDGPRAPGIGTLGLPGME
jgi:delta1-piperideine-2-carboxylate reductase